MLNTSLRTVERMSSRNFMFDKVYVFKFMNNSVIREDHGKHSQLQRHEASDKRRQICQVRDETNF